MERTLNDAERALLPTADENLFIERSVVGVIDAYLCAPVVADVDRISVAADWANGARVIAAQPDVPRNLTALLVDANASILTGTLTINGIDWAGRPVQEIMNVAAGVGLAFVGTKIFARVDTAVITNTTGAVDVGVDQLVIGVGNVIGLPVDIVRAAEVIHVWMGGARVTPDAVAVGVGTSGVNCVTVVYDGIKIIHVAIQPTRRVVA